MTKKIGVISSISDNIITTSDVGNNLFIGQQVSFGGNNLSIGCIIEITNSFCKIVLVRGNQSYLSIGTEIYSGYFPLVIQVGFSVLGKIIDPLGYTIGAENKYTEENNMLETFFYTEYSDLVSRSPSIIER